MAISLRSRATASWIDLALEVAHSAPFCILPPNEALPIPSDFLPNNPPILPKSLLTKSKGTLAKPPTPSIISPKGSSPNPLVIPPNRSKGILTSEPAPLATPPNKSKGILATDPTPLVKRPKKLGFFNSSAAFSSRAISLSICFMPLGTF